MIYGHLDALVGFFGLVFLTPEAAVIEANDAAEEPRDARMDAGDGDLNVVQISIFVWSREVVGAEGAEQQGQKEIQHL